MTHAIYLVLIDGQPWGSLYWRSYRLTMVRADGSKHLFHRSVRLQKAREAIARETGKPVNAVRVMKLAGTVSGEARCVTKSAAPTSPQPD